MAFVCNFRESLNQYGWRHIEREFPEKIKEIREKLSHMSGEDVMMNMPEFCSVNNAEFAPDLASIFIVDFIPKFVPTLDQKIAIRMTEHLCGWL